MNNNDCSIKETKNDSPDEEKIDCEYSESEDCDICSFTGKNNCPYDDENK